MSIELTMPGPRSDYPDDKSFEAAVGAFREYERDITGLTEDEIHRLGPDRMGDILVTINTGDEAQIKDAVAAARDHLQEQGHY